MHTSKRDILYSTVIKHLLLNSSSDLEFYETLAYVQKHLPHHLEDNQEDEQLNRLFRQLVVRRLQVGPLPLEIC